jgi:hypothetical protein
MRFIAKNVPQFPYPNACALTIQRARSVVQCARILIPKRRAKIGRSLNALTRGHSYSAYKSPAAASAESQA